MNYSRRHFFQSLAASALVSAATGADAPKQNMIVRSTRPLDLEMPLDGFTTFLRAVERFFVRSHQYTPEVTLAEWKVQIDGLVEHQLILTMEDLKKLPRVEMVSVIECAGNGRGLYEPPVPGIQWAYGSVGNAKWAGVRLADVLAKAQVKAGTTNLLMVGATVPIVPMPDSKRRLLLN